MNTERPAAGRNTDEAREQRRQIVLKHCRRQTGKKSGDPAFCFPSREEIAERRDDGRRQPRRSPIIYDSVQAAQACADELFELDGKRQEPYVCPRSGSGHAHLYNQQHRDQTRRQSRADR